MRSSRTLGRDGFTLIEVMAAVAVLGIVYVVVARSAIQGLQTEGDASRRLRASLLADQVLNDLELTLAGGTAPTLGKTETSEDEFSIVAAVTPFDADSILPEETGKEEASAAPPSKLELLKPAGRGGAPTMLSIAVRVSWIEGIREQEVTRHGFAFDLEAAAPLLEKIEPAEKTQETGARGTSGRRLQPGATRRSTQ